MQLRFGPHLVKLAAARSRLEPLSQGAGPERGICPSNLVREIVSSGMAPATDQDGWHGTVSGKGSGRVISVGPDSHPGVTLPWPVSASGWGTLGCTHSNPRSSRASHPHTTTSPLEQAAGASR